MSLVNEARSLLAKFVDWWIVDAREETLSALVTNYGQGLSLSFRKRVVVVQLHEELVLVVFVCLPLPLFLIKSLVGYVAPKPKSRYGGEQTNKCG